MSILVRQIAKKFVSMTRSVTRLSQNMLRQGTPALKLSCKSCLATDHPHTISSIPSGAAIKSQLYRANLHLTSPSHLDIGHFKLIQLRFYLIKQLFIIEIMIFLATGILQPPPFCNHRHFEPPPFWNCRHCEPPTL